MKSLFRPTPYKITVAVILLGIVLYVVGVPFLDLMELKTVDLRFRSRGGIAPPPEIVLAVIDEKSISMEGKWIWPRSKFATLIRKLSEAGAQVVTFDIGFLEPDDQQILETISNIQKKSRDLGVSSSEMEEYLHRLRHDSDYDLLLADAITDSTSDIVLGYFFHMNDEDTGFESEEEINRHIENIQGSRYRFVRYTSDAASKVPLFEAASPQSNISQLSAAAPYSGYFNMFPDEDGVVRWIPGVIKCRENLYASLSMAAIAAYFNEPLSLRISEYGVEEIRVGSKRIPTDEFGRVLVNYHGPQKTFPHISVTDILNDRVPKEQLAGKIVMVGATAIGIYDMRVTPFGSVFPGLEIHASIAAGVLENKYLHQPGWASIFDVLAMVVSGLLLGLILNRSGIILSSAATVLLLVAYILVCHFFFSLQGLILNLVYPSSVIVVVYISVIAYKYLGETRQKKFIRDAFSTYLAPTVVKQLIDSPEKLNLGGEEREITAFFSDVQGFTSISEKLTPKELVELLNEFLTEMTDIILQFEGTVDKFEGDAIIAFFGAPNHIPNHAQVACLASVAMQKRLVFLRQKWLKGGLPELHMRIGLHSGPAVVGNMGSRNRMDYTMMGDTVNIAARLEGVNKHYGTYTLIGDMTHRMAGNEIAMRELDRINVVGKGEAIAIFEVFGTPKDINDTIRYTMDQYALALTAYRNRDWKKAISLFETALDIVPGDGPSKTMLLRCRQYLKTPPPSDWNGAFTMTSK